MKKITNLDIAIENMDKQFNSFFIDWVLARIDDIQNRGNKFRITILGGGVILDEVSPNNSLVDANFIQQSNFI